MLLKQYIVFLFDIYNENCRDYVQRIKCINENKCKTNKKAKIKKSIENWSEFLRLSILIKRPDDLASNFGRGNFTSLKNACDE